jgi:uncharacterized protein YgiM (DUF1202 family)
MKKNSCLVLGMMLSGSLLAQSVTNAPPAAPLEAAPAAPAAATPAPPPAPAPAPEPAAPAVTTAPAATNAPAKPAKKSGKKSGKKKSGKKAPANKKETYELKTVPLEPGPAVVAANNVNVRGQAKLKSEVLTHLTKGDQVTVLEEIVNNNSGPEEPSAWAKIVLPPGAHVWANATFIDANHAVKAHKLNLRSGPGENFSVVGQLKQGDEVKDLGTKENWVEIEPPTNAYAFVAAQYLKQEAVPTTPPIAATEPPATNTSPVTEAPPMATAATETPAAPGTAAGTNVMEGTNVAAGTTPATPAATEEPPKPRVVEREGLVRGLTSIQAPSPFELISAENHRSIDYLFTTSHELDLRRYKGMHIIVTGEESLDERWPNTPVLTIQKIVVVD